MRTLCVSCLWDLLFTMRVLCLRGLLGTKVPTSLKIDMTERDKSRVRKMLEREVIKVCVCVGVGCRER